MWSPIVQKRDQLDEREVSKKSINYMHQTQYNQCVNKKPRSTLATLCEVQCKSSEKSIIHPREMKGNGKLMEQKNTPVDILAWTCY